MEYLVKRAKAKVNLALHVTGRDRTGYHLLDTLVTFTDFGDDIKIAPSPVLKLNVEGPFADCLGEPSQNLVMRAAIALRDAAGITDGAAITLTKHLPPASGIGGGSSDAATTLMLLSKLWSVKRPILPALLAPTLGADLAMCLAATPLRARGIGTEIDLCAGAPALDLVLVNPGAAVATIACFARLSRSKFPGLDLPDNQSCWFTAPVLGAQRNDLEQPATTIAPDIRDIIEILSAQPGCDLARMSGSGATCFGLFDDDQSAARAAQSIKNAYPQWWCIATRSGPS